MMVHVDMLISLSAIVVVGMVTGVDLIIVRDVGIGLARLDADMRRERLVMVLAAIFAKELHASQAACFDLFGGGMGGRFSRMHGRSELGENAAEDSGAFGVWPVRRGRNSGDGMDEPLYRINLKFGGWE